MTGGEGATMADVHVRRESVTAADILDWLAVEERERADRLQDRLSQQQATSGAAGREWHEDPLCHELFVAVTAAADTAERLETHAAALRRST